MKTSPSNLTGPLQRRDLVAVLTYVNRSGRAQNCVDGSFSSPEARLDRLAAAAGMQ